MSNPATSLTLQERMQDAIIRSKEKMIIDVERNFGSWQVNQVKAASACETISKEYTNQALDELARRIKDDGDLIISKLHGETLEQILSQLKSELQNK